MKTFKDFYNSDKATNRCTSEDESWFDYRVGNINYHMSVTITNSGEKYLIGAWFDGLNYDSLGHHVCRFQTESKNFVKALSIRLESYAKRKVLNLTADTSGMKTRAEVVGK